MTVERRKRPVSAERLDTLARALLRAAPLCAISTVSPGGRAHVNTAYFVWSGRFEIVWLSSPAARHSRNIDASGTAAIAVFDSRQTWGDLDRGIQLFGTARRLRGRPADDARLLYAKRFRGARDLDNEAYCYYRLRTRKMKLFDERKLGGATFVTARIGAAGRPVWELTERYG
jgi:uncharacterized protein YhbP (UPF0306 family)